MTHIKHAVRFAFIIALLQMIVNPTQGSKPVSTSKKMLHTIRNCMNDLPAPWSEAWQQEYLQTVHHTLTVHQETLAFEHHLQTLVIKYRSYWQDLEKDLDRSLFEVQCAQIRWYIESLMSTIPCEKEKQLMRSQWQDLWLDAGQSLLTQFPFLDPNIVQKETVDQIQACLDNIERPMEPIYLQSFTDEQINQIKQGWYNMRYLRVDLMRQLGGEAVFLIDKSYTKPLSNPPETLLIQGSFKRLLNFVWFVAVNPPDYYRIALKNQAEARRKRRQLISRGRVEENRLRQERSRLIDQVEYLSYLFAVLLESQPCLDSPLTTVKPKLKNTISD